MNASLSMESILQMLKGLNLNNRLWLAEHLIEPKELESARELQRERDEKWIRELQALHYEGEPTAEEKKRILREGHSFTGRHIRYSFANEE